MYAQDDRDISTSKTIPLRSGNEPYSNQELEEHLIGSLLRYPDQFPSTFSAFSAGYRPSSFKLKPWQCFYDTNCGWAYEAMASLHQLGQAITIPLLSSWFLDQNRKRFELLGETDWLESLELLAYSSAGLESASQQILDAALRRWQESNLDSLKAVARDRTLSCREFNAQVGSQMLGMIYSHRGGGAQRIDQIMDDIDAEFENYLNTGLGSAVSSGFRDLDAHLGGGFVRGELCLLTGRSSMGKTSFALCTQANVAAGGDSVLFFSLEQSKKLVAYQLSSLYCGIETKRFFTPEQRRQLQLNSPRQYQAFLESVSYVKTLDIKIEDQRRVLLHDIRNTATQWAAEARNPSLICLDYINLMPSFAKNSAERSAELGEYAVELRAIAGELNVALVALAQIGKSVDGQDNKRPTMSDISESKKLVDASDVILCAYRDSYYNRELEAEIRRTGRLDTIELLCLKGRNIGVNYDIRLNWHAPTRKVSDVVLTTHEGF